MEGSKGVGVDDVDGDVVDDVADDDDGGGVAGGWDCALEDGSIATDDVVAVATVALASPLISGFDDLVAVSSDAADSFSFFLFFFSDVVVVEEGVVEDVRLLLPRLLLPLLLLLLLLLLIAPKRNCISALGSMVQNAPFPGSSSLRGTLTNALLRERLCRIEFYICIKSEHHGIRDKNSNIYLPSILSHVVIRIMMGDVVVDFMQGHTFLVR